MAKRKPLDPYTLRSIRRLLLRMAKRERVKDANRPASKADSMYWVGAADAYEWAAAELATRETLAMKPAKRTKR